MSIFLNGSRYRAPIFEECDSVEHTIERADDWLEIREGSDICWVIPLNITDESGNEIVSEDSLKELMSHP
jgi:hypothetical protein